MPVCLSRSGCHPLSPVRLPLSVSLSVARCLPLSVSPSPCVPARSCLSVCLSLSASASRRLGSVSLNLHLFLSLSLLTPGLPRVLWLWPWLPRLRRPAVSTERALHLSCTTRDRSPGGRVAGRRRSAPRTPPPPASTRLARPGGPRGFRDPGPWTRSSRPGMPAAGWAERQVGAKGRRSAGLLGRPAAAAPVYGHTTLNAPDLV